MASSYIVEKLLAMDAYTWCSDNGTNSFFDATIYLRHDEHGVVLGYETQDWEDELLAYFFVRDKSGFNIFETHKTTAGNFKTKVEETGSFLEAYLECARRGRASLDLVCIELAKLTFGSVVAEDRLGNRFC